MTLYILDNEKIRAKEWEERIVRFVLVSLYHLGLIIVRTPTLISEVFYSRYTWKRTRPSHNGIVGGRKKSRRTLEAHARRSPSDNKYPHSVGSHDGGNHCITVYCNHNNA